MNGSRSMLKADPTEWLLGEDNPSVRYFMLTDVLEKNRSDPDVEESKRAIMRIGAVPRILAKQKSCGYWGIAEGFYMDKYKGTVSKVLYQQLERCCTNN